MGDSDFVTVGSSAPDQGKPQGRDPLPRWIRLGGVGMFGLFSAGAVIAAIVHPTIGHTLSATGWVMVAGFYLWYFRNGSSARTGRLDVCAVSDRDHGHGIVLTVRQGSPSTMFLLFFGLGLANLGQDWAGISSDRWSYYDIFVVAMWPILIVLCIPFLFYGPSALRLFATGLERRIVVSHPRPKAQFIPWDDIESVDAVDGRTLATGWRTSVAGSLVRFAALRFHLRPGTDRPPIYRKGRETSTAPLFLMTGVSQEAASVVAAVLDRFVNDAEARRELTDPATVPALAASLGQ